MMYVEPKILLENKSVAILSVREEAGRVLFMPTSWHMPISYKPLMVCVCISHRRYTFGAMTYAKEFTLSVPRDKKLVESLGNCSGKSENKNQRFNFEYDEKVMAPEGILGFVMCKTVERKLYGSHMMVIGEVFESRSEYSRYGVFSEMVWSIGGGKKLYKWGEELQKEECL